MKQLKMSLLTAVLLVFASSGFASVSKDETYQCKITNLNRNVLLNDVMTISDVPMSPAQSLTTTVIAKASDGSARTLSVSVGMSRSSVPKYMGLSFGVADTNNGSQDQSIWIDGPSINTNIENLSKINLFLKGTIPLQDGRVVRVRYVLDCSLQK